MQRIDSYEKFWRAFLKDFRDGHEPPRQVTGTVVMLFFLTLMLMTGNILFILLALGLACAVRPLSNPGGTSFRPLSVAHPLWSLISDVRLLIVVVLDRLDAEYARFGIGSSYDDKSS